MSMTGQIGDRWVVYCDTKYGVGYAYMDSFGYQNDEYVSEADMGRLENKPLPESVVIAHVARLRKIRGPE